MQPKVRFGKISTTSIIDDNTTEQVEDKFRDSEVTRRTYEIRHLVNAFTLKDLQDYIDSLFKGSSKLEPSLKLEQRGDKYYIIESYVSIELK